MNQIADTRPGEYFVTVSDGPRWAKMLGPFTDNHQAALDMVDAVREKAIKLDPFAHFYAFGTARIEGGDKVPIRAGRLNAYFGLPTTREEAAHVKS